jgi:LacI family transcriptional regulator
VSELEQHETPEAILARLRAEQVPVDPGPARDSVETPGGVDRQLVVAMLTADEAVSRSDHPFFGRVFVALRGRLMAMGCDLLLCARRAATPEHDRAERLSRLLERGLDGFVAMGVGYPSAEVRIVLESRKPSVFIDFDPIGERAGYVMSANVDGMAAVVAHLHRAGRRRIACIAGRQDTRPGIDRLLGYRSAIERLGLPASDDYVHDGDFGLEAGAEAVERMLALPERPDAIAASSDAQAIAVMVALRQAGLRVPQDVAVTGFDDIPLAASVRPALTTVRQDAARIGVAAAEAVVAMLDDPAVEPPALLLPTQLVVRESCGALELGRDPSGNGQEAQAPPTWAGRFRRRS